MKEHMATYYSGAEVIKEYPILGIYSAEQARHIAEVQAPEGTEVIELSFTYTLVKDLREEAPTWRRKNPTPTD